MPNIDTLEREIHACRNTIQNGLSTRRNHPTYGVTKASLSAVLNRMEGMLVAHRIFNDREECPPNPGSIIAPYAMTWFAIDLADLADQIKES